MLVALAGGVGAARFLRGLVDVVDPGRVTAVVNTGDDDEFHGLWVSPDLDSVTYTLADAQNPELGWGLAGVPFFLLLGITAALLNMIPYAAFVTWPVALLLTWSNYASTHDGGFSFWTILVWPTVVYGLGQLLDGWIIEPMVQGKATNLDPLAILLAVLIGGTLAGLFGMLLAIPTMACLKILAQELVIPRLRTWAAEH